jgi:hypothetical protein
LFLRQTRQKTHHSWDSSCLTAKCLPSTWLACRHVGLL